MLLGGITYISSSGVIAKVLSDLGRLGNRETPAILTLLVIEDLAMAVYLPIVAVMLAGGSLSEGAVAVLIALSVAGLVLFAALRFGHQLTRLLHSESDEALLLGLLGTTLLVAGIAQQLDVSAAVGAFLVGIAPPDRSNSEPASSSSPCVISSAAVFFILFGFSIDPAALPPVLLPAALPRRGHRPPTKVADRLVRDVLHACRSARTVCVPVPLLIARGEFSIVIAGFALATHVETDLIALSGAYVLILAVAGPIVTRFVDRLAPQRSWIA